MPREFHPDMGPWVRYAPKSWQAAVSFPTPIALDMRGRIELTIGRLGAGKTTWSALRATRLARATDRKLATTGIDWPQPWQAIDSFDALEALRDTVLVWDECHLMLPSSKGLLTREHERFLIRFLSLARKRGVCIVGTTQAWTRVATHYRQLVTTVWVAEPVNRGKLHVAIPYDPPEDGGKQAMGRQFFGPAAARIPTHATVWTGYDLDLIDGEDVSLSDVLNGNGAGEAPASRAARGPSSRPVPTRGKGTAANRALAHETPMTRRYGNSTRPRG